MAHVPATTDEFKERIARLEADIEHLKTHDALTGLLTRAAFLNALDRTFGRGNGPFAKGAAIVIAIRSVPRIAGNLGRHVGDYVISAVASRLNRMPQPSAFMGRIEYDHFVILLPELSDPLEALTKTKEILALLSQPVDWLDRHIMVHLSAGVALASDSEGDASTLIHNAELALRTATQREGMGYAFFSPALAQAAKRRADILQTLQTAIETGAVSLNYQPIFSVKAHEPSGFEALMRMSSPELGSVSPMEFIPVAEEAGLINRLGAWALAEACRAASNWPGHMTISVNISPEQFYTGSLASDVHNALELTSFPAHRLQLEITESSMLRNSEAVQVQLTNLHEMGCTIVLDDFGTGYSGLSYLWKFPFSTLKIDKSFISALDATPMARGILQSTIGLAANLGLKVTAEGIETQAHYDILASLGCDFMQGYLLGCPMPETDIASFLLRHAISSPKLEIYRPDFRITA